MEAGSRQWRGGLVYHGGGTPDPDAGAAGIRKQPSPRRILIVEDESVVAMEMALTLEFSGFEVVTEGTAAAALDTLAAADENGRLPALVLMDIRLPGRTDGIEAARVVQDRYPDVAILFVTAQADEGTRTRAEALGPSGYLVKPIGAEQLRGTVCSVLDTRAG